MKLCRYIPAQKTERAEELVLLETIGEPVKKSRTLPFGAKGRLGMGYVAPARLGTPKGPIVCDIEVDRHWRPTQGRLYLYRHDPISISHCLATPARLITAKEKEAFVNSIIDEVAA